MSLLVPVFTLLGLFIGSFINVCIDRLPRGESIIAPPSHCAECNHRLGFFDLIPLFSYIWLRGRCRYCNISIPLRLPVVEGATALIFTFLYWEFGFGIELPVVLVYAVILIIVFVIDLERQLVLNKVTYPGMLLAIVFSFFSPGLREVTLFANGPIGQLWSSLSGGVTGLVVMALPFVIYRQGMGIGDIKLAALVGLMVGFPLIILAVLLSWITGGLVAAILLALKIKGRKDPIPFATFLAVSAMVTLIWGQEIWQWYLSP